MAQYQLGRNAFKGKLNTETDPLDVQNQDYVDALNVQFLTETQGQTLSIMPVLGNKLAFDIGQVSAHNKKYRVKFDLSATSTNYQVTVYRTNKVDLYLSSPVSFTNITDFVINFGVQIGIDGLNWTATTGSDYVDFEITTDPYYEYYVESTGVDDIEILVLEEAIDPSLAGFKRIIGSNDLLGDLFLFSTPQTKLPSQLSVASVTAGSGTTARITTTTAHGLQTYQYVDIQGMSTDTDLNGIWQINVINSTSFDLIGSTFTLGSTNEGTVNIDISGVGEIGVATYNEQTGLWTYTTLLQSKELGFTTKRQIECNSEINYIGKSLYFHQVKYNPPRVFYYNQSSYIQNGGLTYNGGLYDYGSIAEEIRLQLATPPAQCSLYEQLQSGGNISAGNRIYAVRFLTDLTNIVKSQIVGFSNIVSTYQASFNGNPDDIVGNQTGQPTAKINRIQITGADTTIFKYYELIAFTLSGSAVVGNVIKREQIPSENFITNHTGFETTVAELSLDEIFEVETILKSIGNQTIIQNRYTVANIDVSVPLYDLSPMTEQMTHAIIRETVSTTGLLTGIKAGGYQHPLNVHNDLSFMVNETYRLGLEVDWIEGGTSSVFWIDDIRVDANAANITTPNRRTATVPDLALTVGYPVEEAYTYKIKFDNIDLNYLIEGRRIKDLIKTFRIVSVSLTQEIREIQATGIAINSVSGIHSCEKEVSTPPQLLAVGRGQIAGGNYPIFEFPFATGNGHVSMIDILPSTPLAYSPDDENNYSIFTTTSPGFDRKFDPQSTYVSFYFPDVLYGNTQLDWEAGDQILNFGLVETYGQFTSNNGDTLNPPYTIRTEPIVDYEYPHNIREYGCTNFTTPISISIEELRNVGFGGTVEFSTGETFTKLLKGFEAVITLQIDQFYNDDAFVYFNGWYAAPTPVARLQNSLTPIVGSPNIFGFGKDNGVYYVQYYRPIAYTSPDESKFGPRDNSTYVRTGHQYTIQPSDTIVNGQIISGDIFVQKSYVKNKYLTADQLQTVADSIQGWGSGFTMYSQNISNIELRYFTDTAQGECFPASTSDEIEWIENLNIDQLTYDPGYNWKGIKTNTGYNRDTVYILEMIVRILWSPIKPQNSLSDTYRTFPPLQFKDLDPQYGGITHIENINTELFVWQPRNWQREFFNTTGLLNTNDGDLAILGNAGVMSRPGQRISQYGTNNKWSVIKGRSRGGGDIVFWINQEYGLVLRFGADGVNVISSLWLMRGFFDNRLKWALNDTPADGEGICGVWNDRFQEIRWSVRGWKDVNEWESIAYKAGQVVQYGIDTQDIPVYYEAINNVFTVTPPPNDPLNWQLIPFSDTRYYSVFSIVVSEIKNGFTTLLTPKPFIYLPWKKSFLTPNPDTDYSNLVYDDNQGNYLQWYAVEDQVVSEEGYIESIINVAPQDIKTFVNMMSVSELAPYRVEFSIMSRDATGQQLPLNSYLLRSDFEWRESEWVSPIKNDTNSAPNGTPDEDTTQLYGAYIKVKIFFKPDEFQKVANYLIKYQFNARYLGT